MLTILVTGGASGIGLATVNGLLKGKHSVILVDQYNPDHQPVLEDLFRRYPGQVSHYTCDLQKQASVAELIDHLRMNFTCLDVLINNAGRFPKAEAEFCDDVETTFAVNVMAPYLLSVGLMTLLSKTGRGRIINVSSIGERYARSDWSDIQSVKMPWNANRVYNNSKFYLTLLTYALAERFKGRKITVNCLHPGPTATNLVQSTGGLSWPMRILFGLVKPFRQTPEHAARTSLFLATDPSVDGLTGCYFSKCHRENSSVPSQDPVAQQRILAYCELLRTKSSQRLP
ncbi:SDR family NAD(P)-dependent oxidoreductase [Larkinella knui]|uniref:SDR family NAD(P)-dependent oxidoreductase n=1 Tax=Larkinella knui TaxID=2025310 RepID=A0A3P1CLU7_9BACT|nr:SDR family NAD(P)-dependent oxidoreductase [Larkinella knui]RRB13884.1 SDR family NAD(P)-dependent oxidoreductase [Larkinella knui]